MLDIDTFRVKKLLDNQEADEACNVLFSLPDDAFCPRFYGMKTLGAASYLDIKNERSSKYWKSSGLDVQHYLGLASQYNPVLLTFFKNIYSKLCTFFEKEFNVKCILHDQAALPGFHIYENLSTFQIQKNHIPHFDGQYEELSSLFGFNKSQEQFPQDFFGKTLSYTMPISLPKDLCGLRVWDFHFVETIDKNKENVKNK